MKSRPFWVKQILFPIIIVYKSIFIRFFSTHDTNALGAPHGWWTFAIVGGLSSCWPCEFVVLWIVLMFFWHLSGYYGFLRFYHLNPTLLRPEFADEGWCWSTFNSFNGTLPHHNIPRGILMKILRSYHSNSGFHPNRWGMMSLHSAKITLRSWLKCILVGDVNLPSLLWLVGSFILIIVEGRSGCGSEAVGDGCEIA